MISGIDSLAAVSGHFATGRYHRLDGPEFQLSLQ